MVCKKGRLASCVQRDILFETRIEKWILHFKCVVNHSHVTYRSRNISAIIEPLIKKAHILVISPVLKGIYNMRHK